MKPYIATIYYRNQSGKINSFEEENIFLSKLHEKCRKEYEKKSGFQYQIRRAGSSEVIRHSRETHYFDKEKQDSGQLTLF